LEEVYFVEISFYRNQEEDEEAGDVNGELRIED